MNRKRAWIIALQADARLKAIFFDEDCGKCFG